MSLSSRGGRGPEKPPPLQTSPPPFWGVSCCFISCCTRSSTPPRRCLARRVFEAQHLYRALGSPVGLSRRQSRDVFFFFFFFFFFVGRQASPQLLLVGQDILNSKLSGEMTGQDSRKLVCRRAALSLLLARACDLSVWLGHCVDLLREAPPPLRDKRRATFCNFSLHLRFTLQEQSATVSPCRR